MRAVLAGMARARTPPLYALSPQQARAAYEAGAGVLEIDRPLLPRVEDWTVPSRDGTRLAARLYAPTPAPPEAPASETLPALQPEAVASQGPRPAGASGAFGPSPVSGSAVPAGPGLLPVLLFFHGGGFVVGSIATHDVLCRTLAASAGCTVLSLDYRLAPEHRFPTAVEDAWDALVWLRSNARALGCDPARLAVGGDSAGGTLATVCATLARDAGLPLALQLLLYPGCAPQADSASYRRFGEGYVIGRTLVDWFFGLYLRTPAERDDWRFAPLATPDLDGVAPAWIGLAECDPLVDEGLQYADRLRAAGVPVDIEIYRGVTHEFVKMGRAIPEARTAHADAAAALRAAFGLGG